MKLIHAISPALVACCLANQTQAAAIPVPNGGFELLFKPGSTTITAETGSGWTHGVGLGADMDGSQVATYSDATTGTKVDIPGWVNATGWIPSYSWVSGSGSVAGNPIDGHNYGSNGTLWGNDFGGAIQSAAALATVASGESYTLSADFKAGLPESGRVLDLMADGVILTPDVSTNPVGDGTYTKTYGSGGLAGLVGQALTIRVGWASGIIGTQAQLDNVQLSSDAVSETTPPTLISIVDNKSGGPVIENEPVTYTVTFDEAMSASSISAADFENSSATPTTITSVIPTIDPAVFLVMATPTEPGTLQLQIKAEVVLTDLSGNALDTTAALPDDTTIIVNITPPSTACDILTFGPDAVIDQGSQTITLTVAFGTDLALIAPTYTLSAGATCPRASGAVPSPDFSVANPMTYTVTAEDITVSKNYTVTVVVTGPSTARDILTFGTNVAGSYAVITTTSATTGTIAWTVPTGTTVATLAPTYTLSASATCDQPDSAIPTPPFSIGTPVEYVVTAQDGASMKDYTVTVTVIPTESALIWNLAVGGDWNHTSPNWLGQTSATVMPFFNSLNAVFNKTAGGTIAIAAGMAPLSTTVSAVSGTYNFTGQPILSGSLTKAGGGTLQLSVSPSNLSAIAVTGGTLHLYAAETGFSPNGVSFTIPNVTVESGAFLLGNRAYATGGTLTLNGGTYWEGNGWNGSWSGPVILTADSYMGIDGTCHNQTITGAISGPGGLIKRGGDMTVALNASNSYEGPTTVTAGQLHCNHVEALGSGALSINSGAKVRLNYTGEHTVATLTLGGVPQASGTHGSVLSGADHPNNTFFDATGTGMVSVPPSSAADMLTFSFGALGAATIGDTTITLEVPYGTNRTALAPTYTVSLGATCDPASGSSLDFTGEQIYSVTAEDGTPKVYTVTVTEAILPDLFTWANSGGGSWSDSANWTNEADPVVVTAPLAGGRASYTLNFNVAGTYTATNNLSAGFQLNKLNFGSTVTLAGNTLALVANGATLPAIKQNSSSGVTISAPVSLATAVTVGGTGTGQVTLTGLVSGAGVLTKNTSGTLQIYGLVPNTLGGIVVTSGILHLGAIINGKSVNCINPAGTGPVTLGLGATIRFDRVTAANTLISNGGTVDSPNGWGATWSGPITLNANTTFSAGNNLTCSNTISGVGGLTKTGGNTMFLTNTCTSTYTGPTTVTAGTLQCNRADAVSGSSALRISGTGKMNLAYVGTKTVASLTLGGVARTSPGTYGSVASGATFPSDTYFTAGSTGTVTVAASYAGWASTNAPGQTPGQDYDNDGVDNGLEYFMGQTGSSFTAMPGLDATNKVTWPKAPTYNGTWQVQTSPDLAAWTNVVGTDNGTSVSYTLPSGLGTRFVRLLVTPTP